jgi:hypothetical protein
MWIEICFSITPVISDLYFLVFTSPCEPEHYLRPGEASDVG